MATREGSLEYRILGKTGLKVSTLAYGSSPLGGVFGAIDEADGIRAVHEAFEAGINLFDTAPFYGATRSETVLGRALETLPRDQYILETKVGRYGGADFDFSEARIRKGFEESLQRLRTDHADVVICHDIEYVPLSQVIGEAIPALHRLRDEGKLRFIGISGLPLKIFTSMLDATDVDVILSYCRYTLFDTSLESILSRLQAAGVGIINAAPLSMGLLSDGGLLPWHPAPDDIKATCAAAVAYCKEHGIDIARLALGFALANPNIHTTMVGIRGTRELHANLAALQEGVNPQEVETVRALLAPIANRTWPSGLPENQ
jgi:L-galactose dehydrogenase